MAKFTSNDFGRAGDNVLNDGAGIDRLYVALNSNINLTNTQVTGEVY